MERHFFASANSYQGFTSYFPQILPPHKATASIYLKGGNGTGKSTFMKKAAKRFTDMGCMVEYIHCSNDVKSLDGICVPEKRISIIDATAPHAYDPVLPSCIDKIVNLADCLNEKQLREYKVELLKLNQSKKDLFEHCYSYIKSAYYVRHINNLIYQKAIDQKNLNRIILDCFQKIKYTSSTDKVAVTRKLFASAITPEGITNYADSCIHCKTIYYVTAPGSYISGIILKRISDYVNLNGFDTENFYHPLDTELLEHIVIPELDTAFTTQKIPSNSGDNTHNIIDLNKACHREILNVQDENIRSNEHMYQTLLQFSMNSTALAKKFHNRMEEIYISCMDFNKLNDMYKKVLSELEAHFQS